MVLNRSCKLQMSLACCETVRQKSIIHNHNHTGVPKTWRDRWDNFFKAVNHTLRRLAAGRRDTKIWRDRCKPLPDGTRWRRVEHAGVINAWRTWRHAGTNYR